MFDDWIECADCGGDGVDDSMCECERIEDICCCLNPTPVRCDTCHGKGGWHADPVGESHDLDQNDADDR